MTTEFEFGRLVNRLSTGHALRNSMRWGFAMGTVGFQTSKAQADAIRRLCLRKLQATEYDDRLRSMYGLASQEFFAQWYRYWFNPTSGEVFGWFQAAFGYLVAMEKMIDPKVAASVKPTFLGDTDTFAHIAGVAKKTFVLLNSKLEGGSFSLDDWEMALMQELKSRPTVRWTVMREAIIDQMTPGCWQTFRDSEGYFGPDERYPRELLNALVGEGSLLFELYRTLLGNLGQPDSNFQSSLKGIKTDRGFYVDAFADVDRDETFKGRADTTWEWVPVAYEVTFAFEDHMVQGPNVAHKDWIGGWEQLQDGRSMDKMEQVGGYFIWGDVREAQTNSALFQLRDGDTIRGAQMLKEVIRASLTDASNWPWSGERSFKKYQISEVHFQAVRDIVFRQGRAPSPPEPEVEPVLRLEPAAAMDPSDRKRRAHEDREDPEEEIPSAKRQKKEETARDHARDPFAPALVPAEDAAMDAEPDAAEPSSMMPFVALAAALVVVAGGVAYTR